LRPEFTAVLSLLDSTAALRQAAEVVHRTLSADVACGAVRTGDDDTMVIKAVIGGRTQALNGLAIGPEEGLGGQATVLRRTVAVGDYCTSQAISHDFDEPVRAEGLRSMMAAPITRAHRLYGLLYAARRTAVEWSDSERSELLALARQTAVAMEVAESAREMVDVAVYSDRQRLAVELHDSVGATLFSLRATMTSAQGLVADPLAAELLADALDLAERAAKELRAQSLSLHKPPEDKALAGALDGDCRDFTERTGVQAALVVLGDLPLLQTSRAEVLRLAVREALLNIEKHANARSVVISLYPAEGGLGLTVADDGSSPDLVSTGDERGLGLRTVAERVARAGGRLQFVKNEGGGGTMRAWVPAATAFPRSAP